MTRSTRGSDIGILTILEEEFRAVLEVFPDELGTVKGARRQRNYVLRLADAGNGAQYRLAVLCLIEEGAASTGLHRAG